MRGFAAEREFIRSGSRRCRARGRHEVGEHVGPQDLAFVPVQPPAQRFAL